MRAGDAVLKIVAVAHAASALRAGDMLARLGGDEFIVIIGRRSTPTPSADELASQIRDCVSGPVALPGGDTYHAAVSIGAAVYPGHGSDATALLTAADAAMYADKLTNRSRT